MFDSQWCQGGGRRHVAQRRRLEISGHLVRKAYKRSQGGEELAEPLSYLANLNRVFSRDAVQRH